MKKFLKQSKKIFFLPIYRRRWGGKNLINISNKLCQDIQLYIITANNDKKNFLIKG